MFPKRKGRTSGSSIRRRLFQVSQQCRQTRETKRPSLPMPPAVVLNATSSSWVESIFPNISAVWTRDAQDGARRVGDPRPSSSPLSALFRRRTLPPAFPSSIRTWSSSPILRYDCPRPDQCRGRRRRPTLPKPPKKSAAQRVQKERDMRTSALSHCGCPCGRPCRGHERSSVAVARVLQQETAHQCVTLYL